MRERTGARSRAQPWSVPRPPSPARRRPAAPVLEPDVQVVRFQGPPGLVVEVLAPTPVPVPVGDGGGIITVGLKRGVGYRLRVTGIPERPGAELYPVIEIVGHLHRPEGIDPGKYPIRVVFNQDDLDDAVDRGRLVTKVIYLEDPDQAIPFQHAQGPGLRSSRSTRPSRRCGSPRRLGRPVAIVRMGGRRPTDRGNPGRSRRRHRARLGREHRVGALPVPVLRAAHAARCRAGRSARRRRRRPGPSLPRDEYLCDGGDRGTPAAPGGNGRVGGVDPRDAVVRFDIGVKGATQPRVLPTNVVCIYAPRFAEVRVSTGTNQNVDIQTTKTDKTIAKFSQAERRWPTRERLVQNQAPSWPRAGRGPRAKGAAAGRRRIEQPRAQRPTRRRPWPSSNLQKQTAELARNRQKPGQVKEQVRLDGIKSAEGPVVTGIVEGASEAVKVWGAARDDRRRDPARSARPGRHQARQRGRGRAGRHADLCRSSIATWATRRSDRLDRRQPAAAARIRQGDLARARRDRLHDRRQPRRLDRAALGASRSARARGHRLCVVRGDRALERWAVEHGHSAGSPS